MTKVSQSVICHNIRTFYSTFGSVHCMSKLSQYPFGTTSDHHCTKSGNLFLHAADEPGVLNAELAVRPRPLALRLLHELLAALGRGLLLRRHHVQPSPHLQSPPYKIGEAIQTQLVYPSAFFFTHSLKEIKAKACFCTSSTLQPADIGWPTGNGKKLSCTQACCLAQLCLGAP